VLLASQDDIAEVLNRCLAENGTVLFERELAPAFFDLRSRIAGELFQKLVNYHCRLALVVAEPSRHGARFNELVREHRRHPCIRFFACEEEARQWLTEGG